MIPAGTAWGGEENGIREFYYVPGENMLETVERRVEGRRVIGGRRVYLSRLHVAQINGILERGLCILIKWQKLHGCELRYGQLSECREKRVFRDDIGLFGFYANTAPGEKERERKRARILITHSVDNLFRQYGGSQLDRT